MKFELIGVVGAGVMGTGVTQALLQTEHKVKLVDIDRDVLEACQQALRHNLRAIKIFKNELRHLDIDEVMSRLQVSTEIDELKDVQIVVENVTENWDVKKEVYLRLDAACNKDCIFAVNTSALSVTKIAGLTNRPDKIIGMHFMNPVPMKTLVETIKGYHTSEETIAASRTFLAGMNKDCVLVDDLPGFVSNRISHLFMNEAVWVVQDNVADAEAVDQIFRDGYAHQIGPLQTADLIGLDVVLDTLNVLYDAYQDPKFRPAPLLKKMVAAGLLGRKSGQGFYLY